MEERIGRGARGGSKVRCGESKVLSVGSIVLCGGSKVWSLGSNVWGVKTVKFRV